MAEGRAVGRSCPRREEILACGGGGTTLSELVVVEVRDRDGAGGLSLWYVFALEMPGREETS